MRMVNVYKPVMVHGIRELGNGDKCVAMVPGTELVGEFWFHSYGINWTTLPGSGAVIQQSEAIVEDVSNGTVKMVPLHLIQFHSLGES